MTENVPETVDERAFPTLSESARAEIVAAGEERSVDPGEFLYRAGDDTPDFFLVLEGQIDIVRLDDNGESVLARHYAGNFVGELNLLTGQRPYLSARAAETTRVAAVSPEGFRRLMSTRPDLSDVIFRAFVARREFLRSGEGAEAIRIIGSRYSPEALALRSYANRSRLPHTWIDVDDMDDAAVYLAGIGVRPSDVPVVITPTATLRHPTPGEFAEHLGFTYHSIPGYLSDLVVVGTGPAGLAAAVYGASEGLDTISLDAVALGGQAGASSRIENYVGFPNGISGEDLAARAGIQAMRLGARLNAPCEVSRLRVGDGFHIVELADGSEISTRAVIVATGARYRRLDVDDLERFEGAGIYYAATDLEVRACGGAPVIVVGGGNSAGQAAIYLSQQGSPVKLVIRKPDLSSSMSQYLIARIDADPRIELLANTEVRAVEGTAHLERVTLEHNKSQEQQIVGCTGLFCFIGAVPATSWLDSCIEVDRAGFVLTDRDIPEAVASGPVFSGRDPFPFETSAPGVFAVGDVRHGSLKRVAAAVGEGSSAVREVHAFLALHT